MFLYNKPVGGRPTGQLPPGRKAPWDREPERDERDEKDESHSEADSGVAMELEEYDSESDVEDEFDTEESAETSPRVSPWARTHEILQAAKALLSWDSGVDFVSFL